MNLPIILPAHSVHLPAGNNMTKIVNEGAVVTDDHIRAIVERAKRLGLIPISICDMVTGGQTMEIYSNGKRFNPKSGTFEPVGLCPDKSDGLLQFPTGGKLQLPAPSNPMPEIKFNAPPFDKPAAPKHPAEECMLMNRQAIAAAKTKPAAPADASDLLSAGQVVAGPTPYVVAMVQSHPTLKVGDIVRMGDTGSPKHDNYLIRDDFSLHAIAGEHDQYVLLKRWQPAAPADDEATMQAICKIIGHPYHKQWEAERLIRSIQRGEVPGLTTLDKCSDLINEHARAMNERDTLKAEVKQLAGELIKKNNENTDLLLENQSIKAEVERLRAEVRNWRKADVELRKLGVEVYQDTERGDDAIAIVLPVKAERDTARAAHAEAMELLRKWRGPKDIDDIQPLRESTDAHLAKYGKDASK